MKLSLGAFAGRLLSGLDAHLDEAERHRHAITVLAPGAAFESWLSFETRIMIENEPQKFGLAERDWTANEEPNKVDLSISTTDAEGMERHEVFVEFKLIHNNKNWPEKVSEVYEDLRPVRNSKARMNARLGRLAIVGLVGKQYIEGQRFWAYGPRDQDLDDWKKRVLDQLLAKEGRARTHIAPATRRFEGRPHPFQLQGILTPDGPHLFQLLVLKEAQS